MPKEHVVSHLFKHLNEAAVLRSNSLATRFFDGTPLDAQGDAIGLRRVRAAVRYSIEAASRPAGNGPTEHERRRAIIIQRCELLGFSQKQVAAELGLSLRQFYRELGAARSHFVETLRAAPISEPLERAKSERALDVGALALQRIRALTYSARYADAIRSAQSMLVSVDGDRRRTDALLELAVAYAESGNTAELEKLEAGVMAIPSARLAMRPGVLRARLTALRARSLFVRGHVNDACALLGPALFEEANPLVPENERSLWALSLCWSSMLQTSFGEHAIAAAQARLAKELSASSGERAGILRIRVLQAEGDLALASRDHLLAKRRLQEAYDAALEYNVPCCAADIAMTYAAAEADSGNASVALLMARETIATIEQLEAPERGWHFQIAAMIEAESCDSRKALEMLRKSRAIDSQPSVRNALSYSLEAQCLIDTRNFVAANRANSEAMATFRNARMWRLLGFSLRVAAEIDEKLGDQPSMRRHIGESLGLLERYGHPRAYAQALQISARLTGNAKHARQATEILTDKAFLL